MRNRKAGADYIEKIDAIGGALAAIEMASFENKRSGSRFQAQRNLENLEDIVVGVNKFQ